MLRTIDDKALEELIIEHPFLLFPLVRYTERPDTVVTHLYQDVCAACRYVSAPFWVRSVLTI